MRSRLGSRIGGFHGGWPRWFVAGALLGCATSEPIDLTALGGQGSVGGGSTSSAGGESEGGAVGIGGSQVLSGGADQGGSTTASSCGDGILDAGETCDDGNDMTGDGCAACDIECAADSIQDPVSGHCYRLFTAASNQPNAEANCQAWGGAPGLGHLASIGSQSENDFVAPLVAADTWIGADDFGGAFAWIDGTPYSFENWQLGEPNHPGVEHCMFMDAEAKWHDHNCGDATRPAYLCERTAGTP